MDNITNDIRQYYNENVDTEYARIAGRPEFLLTIRFLARYIQAGQTVLDIGGGPGRYALHLCEQGCEVTLFDLSPQNVHFAQTQAEARGLPLRGICGDARTVDKAVTGQFDHVLLMGPLYHLLTEKGRVQAVNAALALLKPGGILYVSFINMTAGILYALKEMPQAVMDPLDRQYYATYLANKSYAGPAFTQAYFIQQSEILPFMAQFPLKKLHLLAQEGMLSPCESNVFAQPQHIIDAWLDLNEKLCEREELLSWGEHLLYIGRKR